MSKEYFYHYSESPKRVTVKGSFATDDAGTGYPISKTVTGRGFAASQTAAGTYSVVFDNPYDQLEYVNVTLRRPSADGYQAVAETWTPATRTLVVQTLLYDGSPAAADPTDDADSVINVEAEFNVEEVLR